MTCAVCRAAVAPGPDSRIAYIGALRPWPPPDEVTARRFGRWRDRLAAARLEAAGDPEPDENLTRLAEQVHRNLKDWVWGPYPIHPTCRGKVVTPVDADVAAGSLVLDEFTMMAPRLDASEEQP